MNEVCVHCGKPIKKVRVPVIDGATQGGRKFRWQSDPGGFFYCPKSTNDGDGWHRPAQKSQVTA